MDVVNHFNEGRKKYISGDFDQAILSFKECLKINSEDKLSETYIDRCNQLISEKPKDWDGVWVMKSKWKIILLKKIFLQYLILRIIGQGQKMFLRNLSYLITNLLICIVYV